MDFGYNIKYCLYKNKQKTLGALHKWLLIIKIPMLSVMNINDNLSHHLRMANAFNKYFLSFTDNKIIHNYMKESHFISNNINPPNYLHLALKQPF